MSSSIAAPAACSKYVPLARLATGGMAEILLARLGGAWGFEKLVVLKRLLPHLASRQRHVAMLLHEARAAARISHPNVCQVYELGEAAGHYTIVMEYLEGAVLGRVVLALPPRRGEFEIRLLAEVFRQVCDGLHHAHEMQTSDGDLAGLVHRDVSPQNLLLTFDGVAKILDFGIAKSRWSRTRTRAGMIVGKVGYLSPEQVRSETADRRSDVFSLGVVLHEALTGESLFHRDNHLLTCKAVLEGIVPDVRATQPHVPDALAEVVRRALAPRREDRPATAADLREMIVAAVAPMGGPLQPSVIAGWMTAQFGPALRERRQRVAESIATRLKREPAPDSTEVELTTLPAIVHEAAPRLVPLASLRARGRISVDLADRRLRPGQVLAAPAGSGWASAQAVLLRAMPLPAPAVREPTPAPPVRPVTLAPGPRRPWQHNLLSFGAAFVLSTVAMAASVFHCTRARGDTASRSPVPPAADPIDAWFAQPVPRPALSARAPAPSPAAASVPAPVLPERVPTRARGIGWLTLDSRPYARVYLDGRSLGVTPLMREPVAAGAHQVRVVLDDGREQRMRVVIEPGKEAPRRRMTW